MIKRGAIVVILSVVIIIYFLSSCSILNSPPSISDVQQKFDDNFSAIEIVTEFLITEDYKNIYIWECNGRMEADFVDINIQNQEVADAVIQLLGTGNYKRISKRSNTIVFLQWTGSKDIGCGVVYTINSSEKPCVEYMTQYTALNKENWYYYVSDYNAWRATTDNSSS